MKKYLFFTVLLFGIQTFATDFYVSCPAEKAGLNENVEESLRPYLPSNIEIFLGKDISLAHHLRRMAFADCSKLRIGYGNLETTQNGPNYYQAIYQLFYDKKITDKELMLTIGSTLQDANSGKAKEEVTRRLNLQ